MNNVFPSTAKSVEEWMQTINMGRYTDAMKANGITQVSQLYLLTDEQLKEVGISMPGHRKRLMQASIALVPPSRSAPPPPVPEFNGTSKASAARSEAASDDPMVEDDFAARRFNSTSSLYISSTITKPDTDEIIFCVSIVIHDRIIQGESMGTDERRIFHCFSEENEPLYAEPTVKSPAEEAAKKTRREVPSEATIFHTIRSVYNCASFPSECLIICLIYMERLAALSSVPILVTSWRPILLAALILAQKVWDDRSLHNIDFSVFCPMFTLREINHLEKKFLELLDFDVSVNTSLYAAYYFQLRTLCQRENREFSLKPMDPSAAAGLEARGLAYTSKFKNEAKTKQHMSADDIDIKRVQRMAPLQGTSGMRRLDK